MTNIGSSNMIHRLKDQILKDERLINCRPRLSKVLEAVEKELKSKTNTKCLDFSCNNKPVESHVIPDAFLQNLRGSGSLVSPHLESGRFASFDVISKKTKPVFDGYCGEHENSLFPWEKSGILSSSHSVASQLMRVADAMWFEYMLRADILLLAANGISPSAITTWSSALNSDEHRVLKVRHESWHASGVELLQAAEDMGRLRTALRRNLELPNANGPQAVLGNVTIPASAGHFVLLADGAGIPAKHPIGSASPDIAPFVISVLYDKEGTKLSFASLAVATGVVEQMENHFSKDLGAAIKFVSHWMRHGNFYWYMNSQTWAEFDKDTKATFTEELERGPYVSAAFYRNAGIERHPVIRFGNGWG